MTRNVVDKSGAYSQFSAKSTAEFTDHTAIAASYMVRPAGEVCHFCVPDICRPCIKISELTESDQVKEYLQNWSENELER